MQDILISFGLAGGHTVGGCAVLQEYFGDDTFSYTPFPSNMKRSMIVSAVSPNNYGNPYLDICRTAPNFQGACVHGFEN